MDKTNKPKKTFCYDGVEICAYFPDGSNNLDDLIIEVADEETEEFVECTDAEQKDILRDIFIYNLFLDSQK